MSSTGYFEYNMRTVVHNAWGGIIRIPALLQGLGARRVLLISDVGLEKVGIVDRVAPVAVDKLPVFNNDFSRGQLHDVSLQWTLG